MVNLKKYIDKESVWDRVPPVFNFINGKVFHVTSENGLKGIMDSGFIKPFDGTFKASWNLSPNATTYARTKNYVCLFDFKNCSPSQSIKYPEQWHNLVLRYNPFNFIIEINEDFLKSDLIYNESAVEEYGYSIKFVPRVEIWSKTPIPVNAFKCIFIMYNSNMSESHIKAYNIKELKVNERLFYNIETYKNL
ncbi:MAG: hypothetical protein WBP46_14725 [Thiolinea sp.]